MNSSLSRNLSFKILHSNVLYNQVIRTKEKEKLFRRGNRKNSFDNKNALLSTL